MGAHTDAALSFDAALPEPALRLLCCPRNDAERGKGRIRLRPTWGPGGSRVQRQKTPSTKTDSQDLSAREPKEPTASTGLSIPAPPQLNHHIRSVFMNLPQTAGSYMHVQQTSRVISNRLLCHRKLHIPKLVRGQATPRVSRPSNLTTLCPSLARAHGRSQALDFCHDGNVFVPLLLPLQGC
jgi:hypothetical protein